MAYQRRYEVLLRVFEPVLVHAEYEDIPVTDNRAKIEELLGSDADERLISLPPDPVADSYRATPIFLPATEAGDMFDRVCPAQDDIRSWHALEGLVENTPRSVLDMIVPKSARRRAAAHRVDWLQENPDTRVFTRSSTWEVSPVWWLGIDPEEDTVIREEAEDGSFRILLRVPILTAAARVDWAVDIISEKSRMTGLVESAKSFSEWLDSFDINSLLELDLGGMSPVIWPDTGAQFVNDWVDGLDNDDFEAAAAAVRRYTRTWEMLGLYARSS